jgi:lipopolysaccharide export system protein LptA
MAVSQKPRISTLLCLLVPLLLLSLPASGQEEKIVTLQADSLVGKVIDSKNVRYAIGHVRITQGDVIITCDTAIQHFDDKRIDGIGNLKIVQDTLTLIAGQGSYFTEKHIAEFTKGVELGDGKVNLTADSCVYNTDERRAIFRGKVSVVDSATSILANMLTYLRDENKAIAVRQVRITLRESNALVYGDSLEHYYRLHHTLIAKRPMLVQLDSTVTSSFDTSTGGIVNTVKVDTLIVTSRIMEVYQDSTISILRRDTVHVDTLRTGKRFVATDSVEIIRAKFSSRSGEVTYYTSDSLFLFRRKPVIWYGDTQLTGDSIAVRMANRKLDKLFASGNSFAVSRSDSSYTTRFDQLTGQDLTTLFRDDKIERIDASRNAISLYYTYDKGKPNGANRLSADTIVIYFRDGRVDYSKAIGGVEGQYYPEKMIRGREKDYDLPEFNWSNERPRRDKSRAISRCLSRCPVSKPSDFTASNLG